LKNQSYILTFIVFHFTFFTYGQNANEIDQKKETLNDSKSLDKQVKLLLEIGNLYYSTQRDSSILYLTEAYKLSQNIDDLILRSDVLYALGNTYQEIDNEKSSIYLFEALDLAKKSNDQASIAENYNDLAADYYKKSMRIRFDTQDSSGIAFCYNNLGIIHMLKGEYDTGLEYWTKSLDLKLILKDSLSAANTMANIAIYYKDIGRTIEALNYFKSALDLELKLNKLDRASRSYTYLGDLHMSIEQYTPAVKAYQTSLLLMDSVGLKFDKLEPLLGISRAYQKRGDFEDAYLVLEDYRKLNLIYQDSAKSKATKELAAKYETTQKEKENALLKSENEAKDALIKEEEAKTALKVANNRYLWIGIGLISIILILIGFALKRARNSKIEIELQKDIVDEKNKEITDSISYAKRLQEAILPTKQSIESVFPESFVLYLPKDIVAGDFYWMEQQENRTLFAVADCTGHGVPGAFVSVVCNNALNRAVREFQLKRPNEILDKVTDLVIETFEKSNQDVKDGMDIALCSLNHETHKLEYAGANNSLYYIQNGEFNEVKASKQPVGKYDARIPFVNHIIAPQKGDCFYLFTDGYADQFGGKKGKKFKYKNFKQLLIDNHQEPMIEQNKHLVSVFAEWKKEHEQIDDVCVAGIKIV